MKKLFNFNTGLRPRVTLIVLTALSASLAYSEQQLKQPAPRSAVTATSAVTPISAVIASDAQFTWWRGGSDPLCKDGPCELRETKENNASLINSMNRATNLTWPDWVIGKGKQVLSPSAAVMNGDLTAFWQQADINEYKQLYPGLLQVPYYPGLGNHDYANNVGDCSYALIFVTDKNMCAKQAIYYMANLIEGGSIPNIVNKDVSQYVMFENLGGFAAMMSATYTAGGVTSTSTTGSTAVNRFNSVILPPEAHDIFVDLQYWDGLKWKSAQRYFVPYAHAGVCYSMKGTIWNASTHEETCSKDEWPDGSYGSLSYSYDLGDYHFVQLHLTPGYDKNLPGAQLLAGYPGPFGLGTDKTPSFHVTSSWPWLKKDLAAATAAGKFIVLNMHAADGPGKVPQVLSDFPLDKTNFAAVLKGNRVVAIFSGHIHNDFGYMGAIPADGLPLRINGSSSVPWFRSGSAECRRFLVAEFHGNYFNVGSAIADGSGPSWAPQGNVCDTTAGYDVNNASTVEAASYVITTDFGLTAQVLAKTPNSSGGASVVLTGTLSDPGRDVTLSIDWQDGKNDSLIVPRSSGTASFTLYHTYSQDDYQGKLAYLFATDGVLTSDGLTVQIGVIDSKPPVTTGSVSTSNGRQVLNLMATDTGGGVKETLYTFDSQMSQVYAGPVTIPPGVQNAYFWSIDFANNVELRKTIPVDSTPPTTTGSVSPVPSGYLWFKGPNVNLTLSATDGGSGVAATFYSIDGAASQTYTTPVVISGEGRHTVSYWSVDRKGNQEDKRTVPISIDSKPPVVSVQATLSAQYPYGPAMISISATATDSLSGIDPLTATYTVSGPGGQTSGWFPYTTLNAIAFVTAFPGQPYTVTVTVKDLAGNTTSASTTVAPPPFGF